MSGDFEAPTGVRTRGTVLVAPGRGETVDSYARFGTRLAADAYRVRVLPSVSPEVLAAAADDAVRPLALVGSDAGAAELSALLAQGDATEDWWPQGVVLAGLPGHDAPPLADWEAELDARTHCPVQRAVLTQDEGVRPGSLAQPVDEALLDAAYASTADVPHLLLVGAEDAHTDRDAVVRLDKALPCSRLAVVAGVHHDVLNDVHHRAVAAEVVGFLEALRLDLTPVVAVERSDW